MTDQPQVVDSLVNDVRDLLDVGYVGLYEFIWILRGMDLDEPDSVLKALANNTLERIVASDRDVRGVLLTWPITGPVGDFSLENVPSEAWNDIGDEAYPGIVQLPLPGDPT